MNKYEQLKMENEQYRETLQTIKETLKEATVINYNLGNIIKLLVDYDLAKETKMDLVKRFAEIKTINESTKQFNEIKEKIVNEHGLFV